MTAVPMAEVTRKRSGNRNICRTKVTTDENDWMTNVPETVILVVPFKVANEAKTWNMAEDRANSRGLNEQF